MRARPWLTFLLPLLLLFSQQALVLHELEHYRSEQIVRHKERPAAQQACEKCLALAPMTGAVAASPFLLALGVFSEPFTQDAPALPAGIRSTSPRNRGPPIFL